MSNPIFHPGQLLAEDALPWSRRDILRAMALLSGALAVPQLASAQDANAPVRIGYLPITDAAALMVAHSRKLFEAEGLQVEAPRKFRSWAQILEAFMAGQVNVVHLLSPMVVWSRYSSKLPAKVVAWAHMAGSAITVAPNIKTVAELGGRKVAVPFWYSIHNVVLQAVLRSAGLKVLTRPAAKLAPNEVLLSVMAPSDMVAALGSGHIAGYIVAEPFNAAAEAMGIGRVLRFTGDVWRDHACCVLTMHERDLNQRPEWSQKVVNAVVKAQHWLRDNRQASVQLLAKDAPGQYTAFAAPVLERVLVPNTRLDSGYTKGGAVHHADWNSLRIDFQPYPFPSYTERLVKMLKDTQVEGNSKFLTSLEPAFAARDMVDDRFVRKAIAGLGGMKAFGLAESYTREESFVV